MTRAYIRLDPAFDERKESYPDGPYAALIGTLCLAEAQPDRGRFRSLDYLRRLLGKRGRHVRYLVDHKDIVVLDDGRVYVDGWDEWQEGDVTVKERVARLRARKGNGDRNGRGNGDRNGRGNGPDRSPPVTLAVRSEPSGAVPSGAQQMARAEGLPHITPAVQEAGEAITGRGILAAGDRQLTELDRQCEAHGPEAVIEMMRALDEGRPNGNPLTWRQLVWGAMKRLEPFPGPLRGKEAKEAEKDEAIRRIREAGTGGH